MRLEAAVRVRVRERRAGRESSIDSEAATVSIQFFSGAAAVPRECKSPVNYYKGLNVVANTWSGAQVLLVRTPVVFTAGHDHLRTFDQYQARIRLVVCVPLAAVRAWAEQALDGSL